MSVVPDDFRAVTVSFCKAGAFRFPEQAGSLPGAGAEVLCFLWVRAVAESAGGRSLWPVPPCVVSWPGCDLTSGPEQRGKVGWVEGRARTGGLPWARGPPPPVNLAGLTSAGTDDPLSTKSLLAPPAGTTGNSHEPGARAQRQTDLPRTDVPSTLLVLRRAASPWSPARGDPITCCLITVVISPREGA